MEDKITINLNELTEIQKEKLLHMLYQFEDENYYECESIKNAIDLLQEKVYDLKFNGGQVYEL
jgi:hypothetical protein